MLGEIHGEVRFKEPLAFHTSLRCGGPADIFIIPQDVDDVRKTLMFADKEKLPVALLGSGHNTLVRDRGFRGIVLKIEGCLGRDGVPRRRGHDRLRRGPVDDDPGGRRLGLGGIECLVGIPATVGGALAMNAGTPRRRHLGLRVGGVLPAPGRDHRRAQARAGVHLPRLRAPDRGHPPGRPDPAPPEAAEGDPGRDPRRV